MTTDLKKGINEDIEEYRFAEWVCRKPSKINHYSIKHIKGDSLIWFRDAKEVIKFGKWLIDNIKMNPNRK